KGREGILKVHTRKIKMAGDVDLTILARGTPGMSGADLANMVNEAALLAARKSCDAVAMEHFEEAKDKVLMGTARKSLVITEEEKKVIAYHESGHTLVSRFLPQADPIHKVTIIPRGLALGVTQALPIDERHTHSKEYLETALAVLMGGRVAELTVFGRLDTGAGNDLERATRLARKMVCNWGMSEKLGPVTFGKTEEHIFLGREIAQHADYSEATALLIDQEIRSFVDNAEAVAQKIVTDHVDKLHAIAKALLEREIIDGKEVDEIIGRRSGDTQPIESPVPSK
ncbi:cell division protein FtsH, partial [candidate division GN15 bacterium]